MTKRETVGMVGGASRFLRMMIRRR